ncbi:DUF1501 domain-containing protein [Singulisphaera sp. PoT]|uniref:DUF1501 domain-containing protein n=1 Tax=Singulisphaera sp. PoT TaxID=3411797 RepID=UPI003BF4CA27
MMIQMGRRQFLRRGAGLTALTATVPTFLGRTASAFANPAKPIPGLDDDRVLVVVQLAGGNDGLNTLIPHGDDAYYKARPKLAIDAKKVLKIDDYLGFHHEMVELRNMLDKGQLAVVQDVGYPNPDRSHFRSSEIWETGSSSEAMWTSGWLGRYFDNECTNVRSPVLGLQLGERPAQTFSSTNPRAVTLANPAILDWPTGGVVGSGIEGMNRVEPMGIDALDFVQRSANETLALAKRLKEVARDAKPAVSYAPFEFSQSLKLIADMIAAEIPTRVYYVSLGGFDTHAAQSNRHAALLQELSQGLSTFHRDLELRGHLDRTLVMTFSEFGRRVAENKSGGTDHGTSNVMFLTGGNILPGLHGGRPELKTMDAEGDLIFKTDFRSVYAAVLKGWFNADADRLLAGHFAPAPILKSTKSIG